MRDRSTRESTDFSRVKCQIVSAIFLATNARRLRLGRYPLMQKNSPSNCISVSWSQDSRLCWVILSAFLIRLLYLGIALFEVYRNQPLFRSNLFTISSVDYWDIEQRFYQFATRVYKWRKIPYVNYPLEYPQLAGGLFQLIYSFQPGSLHAFALSLHLIQLPLEVMVTVIIYRIALQIYGRKYASAAALFYNVSPLVLHTWVSRFDAIPVFLTLTSLYLILRRRYVYSFLMVAVGIMFKWYPVLLLFPYISYMRTEGVSQQAILRSLKVLAVFCLAVILPFLALSPQFFLESYVFHLGRGLNYQSLWVLLLSVANLISATGLSAGAISSVSMFLQLVGCLSVLIFRIRGSKALIIACSYILMVFVFFNKFYSPQYAVWFTPFLLLSLEGAWDWLLQILLQVSLYVEYPLLWNLRFSEVYPYFYWAVALKFLLLFIIISKRTILLFRPPISTISESNLPYNALSGSNGDAEE